MALARKKLNQLILRKVDNQLSRATQLFQSTTPYLRAVKRTLQASMCVENFNSQKIERHNKPEVEVKSSSEVLLESVIVSRNQRERVFIEPSINSLRVSITIKQVDGIEKLLCNKLMTFMMRRAENFIILRRKAVKVNSPCL